MIPVALLSTGKKRDGVSAVGGVMCSQVNGRVENRSIGQGSVGGGLQYKPGQVRVELCVAPRYTGQW